MQIAAPVLGFMRDLDYSAFSQIALRLLQRLGTVQSVVVIGFGVFKLEALEGVQLLATLALGTGTVRHPVHSLSEPVEERFLGRFVPSAGVRPRAHR